MRLLVLDGDERFGHLLRSTLEQEGHVVALAASLSALRERLRGLFRPDIVLVDQVAASGASAAALRGMLPVGCSILVSGAAPATDPGVARLLQELGASSYLRKPFSIFDLPAQLERYIPRQAPAGNSALAALSAHLGRETASTGRNLSALNTRLAARIWSTRATGLILLERGGDTPDSALVAGGGPLDPSGWRILQSALDGRGKLSFQARPAKGEGDWMGLGSMLYGGTAPADEGFFEKNRYQAVLVKVSPEVLAALPLPSPTRKALSEADAHTALGELLGRLGLRPAVVVEDLCRLRQLGLVDLQQPVLPPAQARPDRPSPTGAPRGDRSPVSKPVGHRSSPPRSSSPRSRPSDGSISSASSTVSSIRRRREGEETLNRLRVEHDRLKGASPWVVLGVPADATPELIAELSERMRRRYRHLERLPELPEQARQLAAEIGQMIERAQEALRRGGGSLGSSSVNLTEEQRVVAAARDAMRRGDWVTADRLLVRARDHDISDPVVLANLGWTRFHNTSLPEQTRRQEARELLLLAEQFAPDNLEGVLYLARLLLLEGEVERAAQRTARLLRKHPDNEEVQMIDRECRRLLAPGGPSLR